jgi:hypothetical protein
MKQLQSGMIIDKDGKVLGWNPFILKGRGFKTTGFQINSADLWEMRKAAQDLDTPIENLTAFRMVGGEWIHFLLPEKELGGGYVDHAILPK